MLYGLLEHKFGSVSIANQGAHAQVQVFNDPLRPGKLVKRALDWGEYYCVCCPFCKDTRHRLWINHTFGADIVRGRRTDTHLAVCYNESCMKQTGRSEQLADLIFGGGPALNIRASIKAPEADLVIKELGPPGEVVPIDSLPSDHQAVEYLTSRNFDVAELAERFQVGLCTSVAHAAYRVMLGRIYIPAYDADNKLVAWQGRVPHAGDVRMKYFTQGRKSQMLYNATVARTQPVLILVEGAPSVWRLWPAAVSGFGKTLSYWQELHIVQNWAGKPVFVVLDRDAGNETEETTQKLCAHNMAVVPVFMPDDRDPADYTRPALFELLTAAADAVSVQADLSFLL